MKSRWSEPHARAFLSQYRRFGADLALRTYSARLIGQDPTLVLHGGGNTSVKTTLTTVAGTSVRALCVKGSGWDLASIEPAGHPAVKLDELLELRSLNALSDESMVNALRANMLDSTGPNPSVEALLHAYLPHKFIDHTHADAVLSLVDQPDGMRRANDWAGGRLGVVPYIMPGFALSKLAAEVYEKDPAVEGLLLYKHGIFTFGESAKESYGRMVKWVSAAERQLTRARSRSYPTVRLPKRTDDRTIGAFSNMIRGACDGLIVRHRASPEILDFVNRRDVARFALNGPATPDHIIRTKAVPVIISASSVASEGTFRKAIGAAVEKFKKDYRAYYQRQSRGKKVSRIMLDPFPRVVLVPGSGVFSLGPDVKAADIALDIYEHTIRIINNGFRVGRYEALPEGDLFDMEYWSLEQAKLGKTKEALFNRKVVWISGAASGIGRATAAAFLAQGAHVFMTDRERITLPNKFHYYAERCDVTRPSEVARSFESCSRMFGGVDIVVSNAGYAPTGEMATLDEKELRRSFEVNFFAHQNVARAASEVFARQQLGGALLFNASKSAFNPGPGFGPYALPKASVIALMKQYAIELGPIGVRCNAVNADRVRTGLFAGGLLEKRAKARGLSVNDYLSGNLLREEVTVADVAQAFLFLAQATKTTGATLPVDGGNVAAFPR